MDQNHTEANKETKRNNIQTNMSKLDELKEYLKTPTERATSRLFTIMLVNNSKKSPRACAFSLDKFVNSSAENMQVYIDAMYNSAPSSIDEIAATTTLHTRVVPALFRAIEHGGVGTKVQEEPINKGTAERGSEKVSEKEVEEEVEEAALAVPDIAVKVGDGIPGANGVVYYGAKRLQQDADPEVAHRLICALLRPPSTWLVDRRTKSSQNKQQSSVSLNAMSLCSLFHTPINTLNTNLTNTQLLPTFFLFFFLSFFFFFSSFFLYFFSPLPLNSSLFKLTISCGVCS